MSKLHLIYDDIDTLANLNTKAAASGLQPRQWYWATDEDCAYYAADNSTLVTVIDSSIYTADGTLLSNRVITLDDKSFELFDYADDLTGGVLTHGRFFRMIEQSGEDRILMNAERVIIGDTGGVANPAYRVIDLDENSGKGRISIVAPEVVLNGLAGIGNPSVLTIEQFVEIRIKNIKNGSGNLINGFLTVNETGTANWEVHQTDPEQLFFMSLEWQPSGWLTLKNDVFNPGNEKYYGTNSSGTKGWFDLPGGGGGSSKWSQGTGEIYHTTDQVRIGEVATDAGRTLKLHGHTENLLEFDSTASSATFRNRILFRANGNPRWLLGTNGVESSGDAGTNLTLFGYNDADTASGFITLMRSGEIHLAKTLRLDYSITEDNTLTDLLAVTANGTVRTVDKGELGGGGIDLGSEITTSSTLTAGNSNKYIPVNSASAINITIDGSVHSEGDQIVLEQTGNGVITVVAGAGMTLNGDLNSMGQYKVLVIFFKSATVATVIGGE